MQLSAKTLTILKNFATINPSIIIRKGDMLASMSPNKTIVAKARVGDQFPSDIAIYNLGRFLSSISLFSNPEIEFGDTSARIREQGRSSITYHYSDASLIVTPPDKDIKLPSVDAEVNLTNKDIQSVTKALGVLGLPEIALVGDGERLTLEAMDSKNPSADGFQVDVGGTDKSFRAIFRPENLKLIDGDYAVKICSKGISQFVGTEATYWIAVEAHSTF